MCLPALRSRADFAQLVDALAERTEALVPTAARVDRTRAVEKFDAYRNALRNGGADRAEENAYLFLSVPAVSCCF